MAYKHKAIPLGGGGYNFTIKCTPNQPENPKENTIWIITETPLGEWQFAAEQPTIRADGTALQNGDVWIKTADHSNREFNALKKYKLMIYPVAVCQIVGGVWTEKDSKIYQNGNWGSFFFYVYNNGIKHTTFSTGGSGYQHSTTYNEDNIKLYIATVSANGAAWQYIVSDTLFDLTGYTEMLVEYKQASGKGNISTFLVAAINKTYAVSMNDSGEVFSAEVSQKKAPDGNGSIVLDISNVSQGYPLVGISNDSMYYNGSYSTTACFTAIYFG